MLHGYNILEGTWGTHPLGGGGALMVTAYLSDPLLAKFFLIFIFTDVKMARFCHIFLRGM